jgi:hypothetical protein
MYIDKYIPANFSHPYVASTHMGNPVFVLHKWTEVSNEVYGCFCFVEIFT